jgi:hypothetical protein
MRIPPPRFALGDRVAVRSLGGAEGNVIHISLDHSGAVYGYRVRLVDGHMANCLDEDLLRDEKHDTPKP